MSFSYLAEKVRAAAFSTEPFKHVQINDFFTESQFAALTSAPEIQITNLRSDEELFDTLFERGYKIIGFPGCIIDKAKYIKWHKTKKDTGAFTNSACEGFGVTLRLVDAKTPLIQELTEYLQSEEFVTTLADKFEISLDETYSDNGLQKYLDGYEISPHPDIRKKALTFMVNINPGADAEERDHHTHYLQFRDRYKYIETFWDGNPDKDRCWVPWSWCETKKMQRENNSIVIFSPSNQTIHAVKANYNHLENQRTQLYGNLWYHEEHTTNWPQWEDISLGHQKVAAPSAKARLKNFAKGLTPAPVKALLGINQQDPMVLPNR